MRLERTIAVLVLATGVICGRVVAAADQAGEAKPPTPTAADSDEPKYPPGQKTKVGTNPWIQTDLKPEHAVLTGLAGKFTTKVHVYTGPFARMFDTEGTAEGKLLMGGAFVQFTHAEKRMKQPFEAMTIYGFDQANRKYTAASVDNTSTALVNLIGTYDAEKKQLVMSGRFMDQHLRVVTILRTVTTFVDANSWTYEEFVSHKVGEPETKLVSILFTRS